MEQIVQQYIQAKGLNEQQAQQLIQELQKLDEQQLQQVVGKMQQQLGGQNQELEQQMSPNDMQQPPQQIEEEMMMQHGGKIYTNKNEYLKAKKAYDDSLALYKQGKIDKEQYLKNIKSFDLDRKDQFSENSNFLKTPTNTPLFNRNLKIKPIKQGRISAISSSSQESGIENRYLKNSNNVFSLKDGSSLDNQIRDGYFLYKKPKQYPQFSEVQNVSFPKEYFNFPELNAQEIFLPKEEVYIAPKQKEYTTGQQVYELNDDYLQRIHQENIRGIKQPPKLIRNQYGGVPVSMDGLYEYPNQKVVVPSNQITMKGINYPVEAYDADNGEFLQTMQPNQNYQFDVDNVLEVPKGKFGISKMQSGGKSKIQLKKKADGNFKGNDGNEYGYDSKKDEFYKITPFAEIIIPKEDIVVENFNLTKQEQNKFINNTLPEVTVKGKKPPITNYFQPQTPEQKIPIIPNRNTPVEAIGNPNLRAGDRVDTVGGKPVKDFGISNKTDKFGFVSRLKGEKTSKQDNINDYKTWVKDWSTKIDGFDKLPYANQQMVAMQWVKAQRPDVYDGLKKQWEAKGYNKNGKGFEGFLNDGMYANITSSLRPSTLTNNEEPVPNFVDANLPVESGNSQPINYTGTVDETPISLPNQNDDEEELDMKDVVLGKLNNTDYSGRYLSNLKLRNNTIKMPYFGRTDLKNPSLYTQNISPYLNDLYAANNAAKQNLDMNSAVGQSAQIQLGANLLDRVNDVSGKVYNTNMQQTVNWENALADIYNKQQQIDDGNRRQYDDDVNRILANKQNVDNEIDRMGYEFKQTGVRNKNNLLLSQMLHPNYVIQDDGTMVRKGEKFNKGYNEYLEEEMKRLKEENSKLKAKYGIKKKLK